MSNYGAHVWTIIITLFTFLLAFFVWFFGFNNMKNTLASDNLQDAVRTSAYLAQDKSERAEPGAFIINKPKFDKELSSTKIKQFGNSTLGSSNADYTVYYLPDDASSVNNGNQINMSHGNNDTTTSDKNASTKDTPWIAENDSQGQNKYKNGNGYETIRGIRVVVTANNKSKIVGHNEKLDKNPNSMNKNANRKSLSNRKKFGTFTATDIIQTLDKTAKHDTYNDLTR